MDELEKQDENTLMDEILREEIERALRERRVTQEEVSEKLGLKQSSISRIVKRKQRFTAETRDNAIKWLRPWDHEIRKHVFQLNEEDKLTLARWVIRLRFPPGQAEMEFSNIRKKLRP